ncbi:hypothetical protein B0H17DRAFT_1139825 [Mycena rosella]|uniref:Uncharacterized protein n=1 Tax=Mycena rosella TaxID=1033263 RepID=A0AAD7D737_MYCRO|nr:hypothetical protein B0H17DRAFT_1139825 [Mycena rosella]
MDHFAHWDEDYDRARNPQVQFADIIQGSLCQAPLGNLDMPQRSPKRRTGHWIEIRGPNKGKYWWGIAGVLPTASEAAVYHGTERREITLSLVRAEGEVKPNGAEPVTTFRANYRDFVKGLLQVLSGDVQPQRFPARRTAQKVEKSEGGQSEKLLNATPGCVKRGGRTLEEQEEIRVWQGEVKLRGYPVSEWPELQRETNSFDEVEFLCVLKMRDWEVWTQERPTSEDEPRRSPAESSSKSMQWSTSSWISSGALAPSLIESNSPTTKMGVMREFSIVATQFIVVICGVNQPAGFGLGSSFGGNHAGNDSPFGNVRQHVLSNLSGTPRQPRLNGDDNRHISLFTLISTKFNVILPIHQLKHAVPLLGKITRPGGARGAGTAVPPSILLRWNSQDSCMCFPFDMSDRNAFVPVTGAHMPDACPKCLSEEPADKHECRMKGLGETERIGKRGDSRERWDIELRCILQQNRRNLLWGHE